MMSTIFIIIMLYSMNKLISHQSLILLLWHSYIIKHKNPTHTINPISLSNRIIMKLLGIVLQNKKGQNLILASTPSLPTRTCVVYSHLIYSHILETYRNRLKIERTINLQENLICACNITKDYIIYVFITKTDLPLAFQAIRKVGDFFNKAVPGLSGSAARMEQIPKKIVQYMSVFEEFLYTRQIAFREYIPMNPQQNSSRKLVDAEIFNKFSHISNQNDRKIIQDTQRLSWRIQANEIRKKLRSIEDAQKFAIKSSDEIYLLDADPQKQKFSTMYRKNIFKMAMGKRKKMPQFKNRLNSMLSINQNTMSIIELDVTNEFYEDSIIDKDKQKQKIKLKMKQRLSLMLQNDKIKQVSQLGQLIVQGTQAQTATLQLLNQNIWCNTKMISKRITPNSLQCRQISQISYSFTTVQNYKSKPILDYVMKTDTFNQDKIPILFVYQMEVNSSNIQFIFKYKMNQKWKSRIYQFDINVHLNKDFIVGDCNSIPPAVSLRNNKVTWKSKEIVPGSSSAKGKILLAFSQAKFPPKQILAEIRLSMKSNCGLIQGLGAQVRQQPNQTSSADKLLLVQYKILPK